MYQALGTTFTGCKTSNVFVSFVFRWHLSQCFIYENEFPTNSLYSSKIKTNLGNYFLGEKETHEKRKQKSHLNLNPIFHGLFVREPVGGGAHKVPPPLMYLQKMKRIWRVKRSQQSTEA